MNKNEFIKWLEEKSTFSRCYLNDDDWKDEVDYADYIYDYISIENDKIHFTWENRYYGGSESITNIYSFDDFVEKYESNILK